MSTVFRFNVLLFVVKIIIKIAVQVFFITQTEEEIEFFFNFMRLFSRRKFESLVFYDDLLIFRPLSYFCNDFERIADVDYKHAEIQPYAERKPRICAKPLSRGIEKFMKKQILNRSYYSPEKSK